MHSVPVLIQTLNFFYQHAVHLNVDRILNNTTIYTYCLQEVQDLRLLQGVPLYRFLPEQLVS